MYLPGPGADRPAGRGVDRRRDLRHAPVSSRALRAPRAADDDVDAGRGVGSAPDAGLRTAARRPDHGCGLRRADAVRRSITATFLIPYLFVIGGCLWVARGFPLKPLRALAAGAVLAAVMFAPVFAVYFQTRPYMGNRPVAVVGFYSAEGPDYLKAHYRSRTYGWMSDDAKPERSLFPRIAPVVLAGVGALAAALGDADCLRPRDGVFRRGLIRVQPVGVPAALRQRSAVQATSACRLVSACSPGCRWRSSQHSARRVCSAAGRASGPC